MALWRAGPERAYVALPAPHDPRERVTRLYRDGEVFELPDHMNPSRTWRPMDEAAVKICKRIAAKHIKEPEPPDDPDDEKQMRKYNRLSAKYAMEEAARNTWFGPDPLAEVRGDAMAPVTLTDIARAQGRAVRASDQQI